MNAHAQNKRIKLSRIRPCLDPSPSPEKMHVYSPSGNATDPQVCYPITDYSQVLEAINKKLETLTQRMNIMMEAPSRDQGGSIVVGNGEGDIDVIVDKLSGKLSEKEKETQVNIAEGTTFQHLFVVVY